MKLNYQEIEPKETILSQSDNMQSNEKDSKILSKHLGAKTTKGEYLPSNFQASINTKRLYSECLFLDFLTRTIEC